MCMDYCLNLLNMDSEQATKTTENDKKVSNIENVVNNSQTTDDVGKKFSYRGKTQKLSQNRAHRGGYHQYQNQPKKQENNFRSRNKGFKNDGSSDDLRGPMVKNQEERIMDRLQLIYGPTYELMSLDTTEKKFSGRSRLFIGNLSSEMTSDDLVEIFRPYGETSEPFINKEKNFGFINLDYNANAEKARRELDGTSHKGRNIKVRFSLKGASIKVKNLTQWVTNELLYTAFSVFGDIESCTVITDERGKTIGEGIVEYAWKSSALAALKHCTEKCFFLTSSLRPVIVENYEPVNTTEGYPEKNIFKKSDDYYEARSVGPRFAPPCSFEHEYGTRWKNLHELFKQKRLALDQELAMEEAKLEAQMKYAKFDDETEKLREQLRARELDRDRQKKEWEERERKAEEQRRRTEEKMRAQEEEMLMRIRYQEEAIRRRHDENSLFMQAQQLDSILDEQDQAIKSYSSAEYGGDYDEERKTQPIISPFESKNQYEVRIFDEGTSVWSNEYKPTKRRRY